MPSVLDRRLKAIMERACRAGTPFEIGQIDHRGRQQRAFVSAPANMRELFDNCCAAYADEEFLIDGDLRLSFAQTHALAQRVAIGLVTRHGVCPGDRVGIAARNSANWIVAYMGVLMAGGCATLLNGWWTSEELKGGVALAGCALVLADPVRAARFEELPCAPPVLVFDHGDPATGLASLLGTDTDAGCLPTIAADDPATLAFTSGSTGIAKAALSDHQAIVQVTMAFAVHCFASCRLPVLPGADLPPRHAALATVPLFHVTGEIALMTASFVLGRRLVMMAKWDALDAMQLIERERVTTFVGVPLMVLEIAAHPARRSYDLSSCAIFAAGGSPRPVEHLAPVGLSLPEARQMTGYGLTETNCLGTCNLDAGNDAKSGSTGVPSSALSDLAVLGPDGASLPPGMRGEIAIRSICNFHEYWRNPEETAAALRPDGFFLTGDIGYVDEDGYLYVVDRKKDIIIRGGENIASAEVEQAIYAHPGVAEASVFGLPHDRYGEVPVAVYAIKDGHRLSEEELRDHLAARIAAFKVPVQLWRSDSALPRLGTQKIDKQGLKARYSQAWEAAKDAS